MLWLYKHGIILSNKAPKMNSKITYNGYSSATLYVAWKDMIS